MKYDPAKKEIYNESSGLCMDAWGENPNNGTQLVSYQCKRNNSPNQRWTRINSTLMRSINV